MFAAIRLIKTAAFNALLLPAVFCAPTQAAETYPTRPVSIVVGFSAGGSTDLIARTIAKDLSERFKQSFVVENRPGANSNLANTHVARARPDGYTLLMVPFGLAVNQYLYKDLKYHLKDFSPIALVAEVPNVLVINKDLPFTTVKDFVNYSKTHPEDITYASPGVGSSLHLAGELFRYSTGAVMLHVPFSGSSPALTAVRAGDVKSAFDNLSTAAPMIKSGNLKALAVTSAKRSEAFPSVPTVAESGYPDYEISSYFGLAAPAGTPTEIINELNAAVMDAIQKPEIKAQLATIGAYSRPNSATDFQQFLTKENAKWRSVIASSGIEPN